MTACKHEKERKESEVKDILSAIMPKMFLAIHQELTAYENSGREMDDEMFSNFLLSLCVSFLINITVTHCHEDLSYEDALLASSKMIAKVHDNFMKNIVSCLQTEFKVNSNIH